MTTGLVIVGGGVAGLWAAWQAALAGLRPVLCEREMMFGGQIATVGPLDLLPGGADQTGVELASNLMIAAQEAGADVRNITVTELSCDGDLFDVVTGEETLRARHVVLATGRRRRSLGVAGETEFEGRGVSHCAECDGPLHRGSDVVVVGGGDAALFEALRLSEQCARVHVLARSPLRARRDYRDRAAARGNVAVTENAVVTAIIGDEAVTAVAVAHGEESFELPCRGVFVFVGATPETDLAARLGCETRAGIVTGAHCETIVPRLYAVGSVRRAFSGEIVAAAADAVAVVKHIIADGG